MQDADERRRTPTPRISLLCADELLNLTRGGDRADHHLNLMVCCCIRLVVVGANRNALERSGCVDQLCAAEYHFY